MIDLGQDVYNWGIKLNSNVNQQAGFGLGLYKKCSEDPTSI